MATNRRDFIFTHHLRERYVQRTQKKYTHLQQCRITDCPTCRDLDIESKLEAETNRAKLDVEIAQRIEESDENRSYLNNTGFMQWYHEKYGYDKRFQFLVHGDLLFVVVEDRGKKIVVTCVSAKTHLAGKAAKSKPKFNKVKTKEEKELELISTD